MTAKRACAWILPLLLMTKGALADNGGHPWDDVALGPDRRAVLAVAAMSEDEKLSLVQGAFASLMPLKPDYEPPAESRMGSAGYVSGIERLGIPPLWETDAGLGVATQADTRDKVRERTSLPSGLATAATWNPDQAYRGGAMIGAEARESGFNVMLAGGINLTREPRNGRNFEYAGEDPLLAGMIVGAEIKGIQSNDIISTIKHFAFNDQETGRMVGNVLLANDQARMSDLLAFEIAIEQADPGAVMCSYNRAGGVYACESDQLLNKILKGQWGYPGFVMSDWGGVHSTALAANAGLDQESAASFDKRDFFGSMLREALRDGQVAPQRLDDMVRRILRSMFAHGVVDHKIAPAPVDAAADAAVSRTDAEESLVLLKNAGALLPLARDIKRLAVIGAHADAGVLAGGGSSVVYGQGGNAVPGLTPLHWPGPVVYHPSSPLRAVGARLPGADLRYDDGQDRDRAVQLAAASDAVLLFVQQWASEDRDVALDLPSGQNDLVAAVCRANPHCVVVIESGGPVTMPWLSEAGAVVEAWYPGTEGGEAIARLLFGEIDASGRLPISFPQSERQLPHPRLAGEPGNDKDPFDIVYGEGAAVGYKWFDSKNIAPLFPFGYGLSYTNFRYADLRAKASGDKVTVRFTVTNLGARPGKAVPQLYAGPMDGHWEAPRRLVGWSKLDLKPGETREVMLSVDRRLLAVFDGGEGEWRIAAGDYDFGLGASSRDLAIHRKIALTSLSFFSAMTYGKKP